MRKIILSFAVLGMVLCGCTPASEPVIPEQTTLPTVETTLTPRQQLDAAVAKTRKLEVFTVTLQQSTVTEQETLTQVTAWQVGHQGEGKYTALLQSYTTKNGGTPTDELACWYDGCTVVEKTREGVQRQEREEPVTPEEIFDRLGAIPGNSSLLEVFCRQKLTASPSMDGSVSYMTRELSREDYQQMLYGDARAWSLREEWNTVVLTVDSDGRLSGLSFQSGQAQGVTDTLTVTILPGDAAPTTPDWANGSRS